MHSKIVCEADFHVLRKILDGKEKQLLRYSFSCWEVVTHVVLEKMEDLHVRAVVLAC